MVMIMKDLKSHMLTGIIFVSVLGTLLHFAYDASGQNVIVGMFTPVNESIWEHTKLLFFPMLIYSVYLSKKISPEYPCISTALATGSIMGMVLIIAVFYTYSGIIGFNTAFVDISVFYISVITAFYVAYKLTISCNAERFKVFWYIIQVVAICLFLIFTFFPPDIPLFMNPSSSAEVVFHIAMQYFMH